MSDNQHWLDRWTENRIGFHESAVNRHLRNHFPRLDVPEGARVFLPLCGKAQDIGWIAQQGCEVVGVELSRIAVEAFFDENGMAFELDETDRFGIYRAGPVTLLQGDFFDLRATDLTGCALAYDRAALIAMTAAQRPRYYEHMLSLLPASARMLLITLEYDPEEMQGPPYTVPEHEVRANYGGDFSISLLESSDIVDEGPRWRKVGLSALREAVFRLDR